MHVEELLELLKWRMAGLLSILARC